MQHDDAAQIKVYLYTSLPRAIFTCKQKHHQLAKNNENHNITVRCTKTLGIFAALGAAKIRVYIYLLLTLRDFHLQAEATSILAKIRKSQHNSVFYKNIKFLCSTVVLQKENISIYLFYAARLSFANRSNFYLRHDEIHNNNFLFYIYIYMYIYVYICVYM